MFFLQYFRTIGPRLEDDARFASSAYSFVVHKYMYLSVREISKRGPTHSVSMTIFESTPKLPGTPHLGSDTTAGDVDAVSKIAPSAGNDIVVVSVTSVATTATSRSSEESPSTTVYRNSRIKVPLPPV